MRDLPTVDVLTRGAEAQAEAARCIQCLDAPCRSACPAKVDIARFTREIAQGRLAEAADTIIESNVLGLSCSRVCPVEDLCEGACVLDRPVAIAQLEHLAMTDFHDRGGRLPLGDDRPGRVACIGSGPASLACAAELRRRGHRVKIFDKNNLPGGLNPYRDVLRETDLVRNAGVEFRLNADIGTDLSIEWMEAQFEAVFIGVGLGSSQRLGLPGGELEGVVDALHLLAECRQGRPRWASQVAVVGGGATATDAAIAMVKLGAAEVRMLYRRGEAEMRSFAFEFARAREAGVLLDFFVQPVAIHGAGSVAAIECVRMEMCPAPKGGRMLPMVVDGSNFRIECEMVVTSIGQSKLVDLLAQQRGVALDDRGHIVIDPKNGQTTNARYFAGGDCVNGGREVVDAVAGGKRAAAGIADWLERYG